MKRLYSSTNVPWPVRVLKLGFFFDELVCTRVGVGVGAGVGVGVVVVEPEDPAGAGVGVGDTATSSTSSCPIGTQPVVTLTGEPPVSLRLPILISF